MKYLVSAGVIIILVVIFSACKKNSRESIVGVWNTTMVVESTELNHLPVGESDTTLITGDLFQRITFSPENKCSIETNIGDQLALDNGYYSISGNKLTIAARADDPEKEIFTFRLAGDKLTIIREDSETIEGVIITDKTTVHLIR